MRKFLAISLVLSWTGIALSGGDDGRAIISKAIKAGGGEAKLAKYDSTIMKEKGTYYGMGDGLPYTSVVHMQRPDKFKMEIKGVFTLCVDGDKGWTKSDKGVTDMPKDQLEIQHIGQKAGWIMHLLPLKDKAYTVKADGTAKVGDMMASVVKVSRKDHPTVTLYFDKKTDHLVKSQFKTKSGEQGGKEVTAEFLFSEFKTVDGVTMPHHVVLKHDGKLYVEADVTEMSAAKFDAKTFAKPASD
ncbi:MAG: hypothetical protein HY289_03610 [Planctomycetes bacterium]|nr:hypothetical protein [Planctomycetota bacterium]